MTVTEAVIKRPTIVAVALAVMAILGISCYTKLNYDLLPKMDIPVVCIITTYSGASAGEVESSVTKVLEDALSSLENVDYMTSTSQEGVATIMVQLVAKADIDVSIAEAQRKINAVASQLPDGAQTPSLYKFSSDQIPILKLGVTAKMPASKLYQLADDQIKAELSKIDGVGQVTLLGGEEREIKININKDKLDAYKLSIYQVYAAVGNANLEAPTGKIEGSKTQYTVRLSGKVKTIADLRQIIVSKSGTGSIIKLCDIAEINDGVAEYSTLSSINGQSSIGILIQKQSDANSVKVSQMVKAQMSSIEKIYASKGVKFDIASDTSVYTLASANAVIEDLLLAILLVAVVMFLFLHSIRNSFIVMISIPASIISVFVAMYIFDFSLNMMTLMALSLVVGILVDDSIVVLENIYRHMEMGKHRRVAAVDGRSEIGFTAVAITFVDIVVFVPMSLVSGMVGNMLREFSLVIVFSTLMSLIVSFTLTPLLASRFSKVEHVTGKTIMGKFALAFEQLFASLMRVYERVLRWGLGRRKLVYLLTLALIVGSIALIPLGFIGTEFMATGDRGEYIIKIEGEPQNSIYQTNMLVKRAEAMLRKHPEVVKTFTNVGYSSSSMGMGGSEAHKAEITVTLVDKGERSQSVEEFATITKHELMAIPGIKVTAAAVNMMGSSNDAPIQILLRGTNVDQLYSVADSIMAIVKSVPGTNDQKLSVDKTKPEMKISLDRDKMSMLGLSVYDVSNTLRLAFAGNTDLQFSDQGTDYDMNVKFDQFDRAKVEDIGSLTFLNSKKQVVELRQFADIQQMLGPSKYERYNRISSLTVKTAVTGRPVGTVGAEIKELIGQKIHPADVEISYKGQMENQADAFGSLGIAMLAAIIFVYLLMVALYNSYLYPFVVLFSIPVAVVGALLALAISWQTISLYTLIGFIMLIGLVAKNAILIVDFTNQLRAEGKTIIEALVGAGKERLRPILMTTLSMVIGMLPIALASGAGSESKNGMAWAIIGGLSSSLLLTLVLVPAVYATLESYKVKVNNLINKIRPGRTTGEE